MSSTQNPKKRIAFTDIERQGLRLYNCCHPSFTPRQLALWFESQFGRKVSNSSVHDILSEKYAYLDNADATEAVRKKKGPHWAELEEALFKWWQSVQPRDVTGKDLKARASDIWSTLPACLGKKPPSFSDGWLSNWRVRHGLGQSTKKTEFEHVNPATGLMDADHEMMIGGFLFPQQSINSLQLKRLTGQAASPPFTVSTEWMLHSDPLNFRPQSGKMDLGCQIPPKQSSVVKFYQASKSLKQGKNKNWTDGTLSRTHHGVKRPRFSAYGSLDTTKSKHVESCAVPARPGISFPRPLWKGVEELFSNCNVLKEDGEMIAGDFVRTLLNPIFDSLEYSWLYMEQECASVANMEKAIRVFLAAEAFQLRKGRDEPIKVILEDWFLDAVNHEVLRSQSPESFPLAEESTSSTNPGTVIPFRRPNGLKFLNTCASAVIEDGMVGVYARTFRNMAAASSEDVTQHFEAKIVINPPSTSSSMPQTIVQLGTRTTGFATTLLTPLISFRNMIPKGSEVFGIAKDGTAVELQMLLSKGKASLTDCDPEGRPLVMYALAGLNCSTLRFLVSKMDDMDVLEPAIDGRYLHSSIDFINVRWFQKNHHQQNAALECLKLMLLAGADPLLEKPNSETAFILILYFGPVVAIEAILNLSHPYVTIDTIVHPTLDETVLLTLARFYSHSHALVQGLNVKIFLVLKRGANVAIRNLSGKTCLHMVFFRETRIPTFDWQHHQEETFRDILMSMVTAGADVYASDNSGITVSQIACAYGHESLWREVLAECGYNPEEVFSLENGFLCNDLADVPGIKVFSVAAPFVRSTRLSFAEYSQQRKSLECVQDVHNGGPTDYLAREEEARHIYETYNESEDSEDYEWVSVDGGDVIDEYGGEYEDEEDSRNNMTW